MSRLSLQTTALANQNEDALINSSFRRDVIQTCRVNARVPRRVNCLNTLLIQVFSEHNTDAKQIGLQMIRTPFLNRLSFGRLELRRF